MSFAVRRIRLGLAPAALLLCACDNGASDRVTAHAPPGDSTFHSASHSYRVETVVTGLEHPWGIAFLPDGRILVTERPGRLRIIANGQLDPQPIDGVPEVRAREQGGLLDVAIHPGFATNRLVYLSFSKPGVRGATTAVVRGRLDGHQLTDVEEIFEADAWSYGNGHFGSRLLFDSAGYLFVSIGDRRSMDDAQNLRAHNGKIVRLHDDGRVPTDNPFVGRSDAHAEIWSLGHRNPQGLAWHPETGELWSSEHGPMGGDEINIVRRSRNYGWPVITYGINYNGRPISDKTEQQGMEQPEYYFLPSIATSGLAIYHGDMFPNWRGDAFVGGLVGGHLARISFRSDPPVYERLVSLNLRIRDVRVGPDGALWLLVDSPSASLFQLKVDS